MGQEELSPAVKVQVLQLVSVVQACPKELTMMMVPHLCCAMW